MEAFAAKSAAFVNGDGDEPKGFLDYDLVVEASHVWGKIGIVKTGATGFEPRPSIS